MFLAVGSVPDKKIGTEKLETKREVEKEKKKPKIEEDIEPKGKVPLKQTLELATGGEGKNTQPSFRYRFGRVEPRWRKRISSPPSKPQGVSLNPAKRDILGIRS